MNSQREKITSGIESCDLIAGLLRLIDEIQEKDPEEIFMESVIEDLFSFTKF